MRVAEFDLCVRVVYLIGFVAQGVVRRGLGYCPTIHVTALGRRCEDAVLMEIAGGDQFHAAVEVHGTAVCWGWGGISGREHAVEQVMANDIWVSSGWIDGPLQDAIISIERITVVDPEIGDSVTFRIP
jgi:hypothetical protein